MQNYLNCFVLFFLLIQTTTAGPIIDKTKEIAKSTMDIVGETATDVGKVVTGEKESPAMVRNKVDAMSNQSIEKLFNIYPHTKKIYENSSGYAVFDSRRLSFLISSGYGQGVVVNSETKQRTYMKMATGGVNIGYGAQFYQLIFLFPTSKVLNNFISSGWDMNADVDAVAGKDAENIGLKIADGTTIYKLNEKGLMLSASLTGTKFWQWDDLNTNNQ